ncbi:hypothetical protein ORV05_35900 [Amycolatopsis cynarae]|uniref:Uncharacterized protein n=1 Tax=Amycolatopsis cynarae TaxID=2995223 RepID=A0ABY7B2I1_9PSEU|nr:hypothetical protein [Amycolatopsis sp. HUAS 11-8]WAL66164.1 hypothetical protein ORV05_35900 [Amycolatopsis sp. HUAS 11-8]
MTQVTLESAFRAQEANSRTSGSIVFSLWSGRGPPPYPPDEGN